VKSFGKAKTPTFSLGNQVLNLGIQTFGNQASD
jgi:hypothetical protein